MIYYLLDAGRRKIKIGTTVNIFSRMSCLKTDAVGKLSLLGCHDGDRRHELVIHALWIKYKGNDEWFKINRRLLRFIKQKHDMSCLLQYERFRKLRVDSSIFQYMLNQYLCDEEKGQKKKICKRASFYWHIDHLLKNPDRYAPVDAKERRETLTLGID